MLAFLTWAAVAASGVFWGLRLLAVPAAVPASVAAAAPTALPTADLQRLLGAAAPGAGPADGDEPPTPLNGNAPRGLVLAGVIAAPATPTQASARTPRGGIALISVAGQPARPFRVGDRLQGNWVLLEVQARAAVVGPAGGPPAFALMLPEKSANAGGAAEPPAPMPLPAPSYGPGVPAAGGDAAVSGDARAASPTAPTEDSPPVAVQDPMPTRSGEAGATPPPGRMTVPETDALKRMGPLTR
jgi:general secretion pathway protein C